MINLMLSLFSFFQTLSVAHILTLNDLNTSSNLDKLEVENKQNKKQVLELMGDCDLG